MAQLVVSAAAATAGFLIAGPTGAQVGFALGSAASASSQTIRNKGPISNDLKAPKLQYGSPIPRIYGRMRVAGSPVWISRKRPIANTTSEDGKGSPKVENTTYTYEVDVLYIVKIEAPLALAVTRVWVGGELKFCALADADDATLEASATTEAWEEMTLFDGGPSQMPWAVYEADVETENALAYRHRTTVGIQSLQLGSSDQIPLVEFEIITEGTPGDPFSEGTLLQSTFEGASAADIVSPAATLSASGATIADGTASLGPDAIISYTADKLDSTAGESFTTEILLEGMPTQVDAPGVLFAHPLIRWDWAGGSTAFVSIYLEVSGGQVLFTCFVFDGGGGVTDQSTTMPVTGDHFAIVMTPTGVDFYHGPTSEGDNTGLRVFQSSELTSWDSTAGGTIELTGANDSLGGDYAIPVVRGIRHSQAALYTSAGYEVPASFGPVAGDLETWVPGDADLADIVEAESVLAGLDASQIDVSDIVGIDVTGFAATGSARQAIEQLMAGYYFEACCSDKLYFRRRGRAVAATIAYEDLAAGVDQATETTFDPVRGNLEELPAQVACGFMNLSADYEAGSEMGDRLIGPGKLVQKVDLPLVLTPAEGKGRALAMVMDALAAGTTATISLTDDYAGLEPTDAIVVPDRDGTTRRMRIVRETYAGVKALELVGDDPSALVTTGLTMDESTPAIGVRPAVDTELTLLDMPILRDADDSPGFMAAFYGASGWPGAALFRSVDGITYSNIVAATEKAITGVATTLLADFDEWQYDMTNTVTVSVNGTLSSSTKEAMQADGSINAIALGVNGRWEVLRFVTATLVSPGVYTLSGLLRGLRGTEWARGLHQVGDTVVVLRPAGLRRIQHTASDIALERFYKAVTLGRVIGTAEQEEFTDTGVALKPFAPSLLRATRDGSDNVTLTVMRRTRLAIRFGGPGGTYAPIGEAEDLIEVDVYEDDTFTTVVRTIEGPSDGIEYSAADQTSDGLTPGDPVSVRAYQISAVVGRGYALEGTV